MAQTLTSENPYITYNGYIVDISHATTNIQHLILVCFRTFGPLGNSIFFVCSTWFLLGSNCYKKKKIFSMIVEIWLVSIIILTITYILLHGQISVSIMVQCLFPTTFSTNWYMTCYILFYAIHPILNKVIGGMNQTELFRSVICLSGLYIFAGVVKGDLFFASNLILWVTIYFVIAYMQRYLMCFADNIKMNSVGFLICAVGFIGMILAIDIGGLHIAFLSDKMLYCVNNCNPFLIGIAITAFNIARNVHFRNLVINYLSSLSMLIYIIHENLILRKYCRPAIWNYVYQNFGYRYVVIWVFVISIVVFIFGLTGSVVYSLTIKKIALKPLDHIYDWAREKWLALEGRLLG